MSTLVHGEDRGMDRICSPPTALCSDSPTLAPSDGLFTTCLQIDSFDTSPFSELFSDLIRDENASCQPVPDCFDQSYTIECHTDIKESGSKWDDGDIDEILVMSPKLPGRLSTIAEELCSEADSDTQRIAMSDFELLEPTPHLCRKRDTGRIFVLKSFNSRDLRNSSEQTILGMLRTLDAPFLPRVYWSFRDNDIYRMVMEYYPRHNLSGQLVRYGVLSPAHALFYACEIAEAVSALHATGIMHRNINPESVLIDSEGHVILSGLDHAKIVEPSGKIQGVIDVAPETKGYQAPEILLGWAHDFTVDCWGFGLLLHFMLSSLNPFQSCGEDRTSLEHKIIHDPIDLHSALQPPARDLIMKCLERNPAIRLSINAMGKHPYFVNVDWDSVAAKNIQVPSFSESGLNKSSVSMQNLRSGYRPDVMHLGPLPCNREPRKVLSTNDLPKVSPLPRRMEGTTQNPDISQALPPIFRMSSLLDDLPNSSNGVYGSKPPFETTTQNVLIPNDVPSDTRTMEVNSRDRMALFWEALDSERRSVSSVPSLDYTDTMNARPYKLRKTRSSIYPDKRLSTLSTLSLQDKLRKKLKSSSKPSFTQEAQKLPTVHFSQDIKHIGSGIGFTYTVPAATLSKASFCSTTPQGCHGILFKRISGLGLGLRFGASKSRKHKLEGRRAPSSLVSSRNQDEDYDSPTFMQDFGGSSWSLVLPALGPANHNVGSPMLTTPSDSPMTDVGPLTPEGIDYVPSPARDDDAFEEKVTHEVKDGDPDTTLRLVASLGIPPLHFTAEDDFVSTA